MKITLATLVGLTLISTPVWADYPSAIKAFIGKDYKQAASLLRPLADQGNVKALYSLATLYHHGRGVEADPVMACLLYSVAEQGGAKKAPGQKNLLSKALGQAGEQRCSKLTASWKPGMLAGMQRKMALGPLADGGVFPQIKRPTPPQDPYQFHKAPKAPTITAEMMAKGLPARAELGVTPPSIEAPKAPSHMRKTYPTAQTLPKYDWGNSPLDKVLASLGNAKVVDRDSKEVTRKTHKDDQGKRHTTLYLKETIIEGDLSQATRFSGWIRYYVRRDKRWMELTEHQEGIPHGWKYIFRPLNRKDQSSPAILRRAQQMNQGQKTGFELRFDKKKGYLSSVDSRTNGQLDGPAYRFYEDGTLHCLYNHKVAPGGNAYMDHGPRLCFDVSGQLTSQQEKVNSKSHGADRQYEKGWLKSEKFFEMDKYQGVYSQYRQAKLEQWQRYQNGQRNGPRQHYKLSYEKKHYLETEEWWKEGKRHGLQWRLHDNGKPTTLTEYVNGKKQGLWVKWNRDSGLIDSMGRHEQGQQHGQTLYFSYAGDLHRVTSMKLGKRHGPDIAFDKGRVTNWQNYTDNIRDGVQLTYSAVLDNQYKDTGQSVSSAVETFVHEPGESYGKKHGRYIEWDASTGQVVESGSYIKGKRAAQ
ncbi:hypothetical protein [Magnetococcus sp. PR-3]|uniref:hypothetical protein n=1 Tax=Magnetococcus sp. PR-3 TaxID=3120355 RepID=UPI002FCE361E